MSFGVAYRVLAFPPPTMLPLQALPPYKEIGSGQFRTNIYTISYSRHLDFDSMSKDN
jgi:hypothetical protein